MKRIGNAIGLSLLCAGLWAGTPARTEGAVVVYTDRSAFEAASSGLTNLDFEGLAPVAGFTSYPSPPGLTLGDVTFESLSDSLFVIDPEYDSPLFFWTSGQYLMDNTFQPLGERGLVATIAGGATAVGTDYSSFGLGEVIVELANGDIFTVDSPGQPELAFIGFISDIAITGLTFNIDEDSVVLDNFTYGSGEIVVPEPSTLISAAVGLVGAGYAWRRRRRTVRA